MPTGGAVAVVAEPFSADSFEPAQPKNTNANNGHRNSCLELLIIATENGNGENTHEGVTPFEWEMELVYGYCVMACPHLRESRP